MSNKFIIAGLLLAAGSAALAETPTFAEITELDAQFKMQEVRNKLAESRGKSSPVVVPGMAAPIPSMPAMPPLPALAGPVGKPSAAATPVGDPTTEIHVMAVYGMGSHLFAEVAWSGGATTVSVEGNSRVGPWTVVALTPYQMTVRETKLVKGKKAEGGALFVINISDTSTSSSMGKNGTEDTSKGGSATQTSPNTANAAVPNGPALPVPTLPPMPTAMPQPSSGKTKE